MARTPLFDRMLRTLRIAESPAPSGEAVEAARERSVSRRNMLKLGGAAMATLASPRLLAACAAPTGGDDTAPLGKARSAAQTSSANIGIVGAGIAGLSCAKELVRRGVPNVTVHEA